MSAPQLSDSALSGKTISVEEIRRSAKLGTLPIQYLEDLQRRFEQDPSSIPTDWANFFLGVELAENSHLFASPPAQSSASDTPNRDQMVASKARRLLMLYRLVGHLSAQIDPLGIQKRPLLPELDPDTHGLQGADLDSPMFIKSIDDQLAYPLSDAIKILRRVYCGSIGSEYLHISSTEQRRWLKYRLESTQGNWARTHTRRERLELMEHLVAAEDFERHLHKRYVGQKRFSLEGGESLIPVLDTLIQGGSKRGITDIVLGMAHRGRLNVLVNILGKSPKNLFSEFEGSVDTQMINGSGDVKYHQGFYSIVKTEDGLVNLALAFNPSHLEIVSPVVEGGVRARQDKIPEDGKNRVLPVTIHGDAAFIGQGVTAETLNLSKTPNYGTGGTLHIVINNQIGFTTSRPDEARSTPYCTEVAKMVQAPIFHVNADDPDAVIFVAKLALEYRMRFNNDVVIDLVCYRRHGHNESDDPMMTQPRMYQRIKELATTRHLYADKLLQEGAITQAQLDTMDQNYRTSLRAGQVVVRKFQRGSSNGYERDWERFLDKCSPREIVNTAVDINTLKTLGEKVTHVPAEYTLQRGVDKVVSDRRKMAQGEIDLDWGMAETLAYATLLQDGSAIRLSGQDSGRGTFAHRHAVLHDQNTLENYIPLQHVAPNQAKFTVINSLLSELAVLGFEYGYATACPDTMVIWEAQFGDFANCAQVVIDQFISSGYLKWGRICQLTLFLPHGYEGQGPEHSSARLERFLQLCAELNMRVWVPTTPAQFFHLLRDQMMRGFRRPLIVMTPKSLLRHPLAKSSLQELSQGQLQAYLPEIDAQDDEQVKRVVLCSGKVYYDLLKTRRERNISDIAIIRVEQLYPFPRGRLSEALSQQYPNAKELVWCQEEPRNQGAWYQIQHHLSALLMGNQTLAYTGREASASSACGYMKLHNEQQQALIDAALSDDPVEDMGERLQDYW